MEKTEFEGKEQGETSDDLENADAADETERPGETAAPLETLNQEVTHLKDQLLRARADFDNYRKRMAREMERVRKTAAENLIQDILPVLDNLELALQHAETNPKDVAKGVTMVYRQFQDILSHNGLSPIPALGEVFDPNVHEAVSQSPSDTVPHDHIMEEFQRGYTLADQVVRPSKVVVSLGLPGESAAEEPHTDNDDDEQP
jgi:molecular chaperone GrpE